MRIEEYHRGDVFFFVHVLDSPFTVDQLSNADVVELRNFHEQADVGHIASGLPAGDGSAGNTKLFSKLLLGEVLFLPYGEYHEVKESMKKLSLARRNVETFLDIIPAREEKTAEHSRGK